MELVYKDDLSRLNADKGRELMKCHSSSLFDIFHIIIHSKPSMYLGLSTAHQGDTSHSVAVRSAV